MKIVSLEAQNVKRLKAIRIDPEGNLVVIGGNNGQGKTSAIDCISLAFEDKSAQPGRPVRDGEKKAFTRIDLGDMVVKRTFTPEGGGTLTVTNAEGAKYSSPQALLTGLHGKLSFDPLEFSRMKPAEQAQVLRDLVGLDTAWLDSRRQKLFEERTQVNRDVKRLKAQLDMLPRVPGLALEEVSVSDMAAEVEVIRKRNYVRARRIDRLSIARRELAHAEEVLQEALAAVRAIQEEGPIGEEESIDGLLEQIRNAEATNKAVADCRAHDRVAAEFRESEKAADALTRQLAEIDTQKAEAVAAAEFPIEGLAIDDSRVTYNGIPFDQASSAEQLRVSVAIGLAANPKLKVLLIRDGSLLDQDNLALIGKMAADADAQVWIERVGTGQEVSVVIEDGEVV